MRCLGTMSGGQLDLPVWNSEERSAQERFRGNLSCCFFFSFLKKRALIDNINLFKRLLKMYVY